MGNTLADLRPNGGLYSISWFTTAGGAVDPPTDWSDNDDATWWEQQTYGGNADLALGDLALPALAVVKSLTVKVRASDPNNTGGAVFATALRTASAGQQATGNTPILDSTIRTYTLGTLTSLNGKPLTGALVNALHLVIAAYDSSAPATQHHRIYEVYVTVAYNQAPTATVTGPSGTIVNTSTPTIELTYADAEGDPMERVRYKVFSAAQYGAGGFDPQTSAAAWSSGELLTSDTELDVGVPLDNGTTYKAYAKVADAGSGGRYGDWDDGPAFTMAVDPPNVPVVIAPTPDTATASVLMGIRAYENQLTDNQASLETDTTGWAAGVNAGIARTTDQSLNGLASLEVTAAALGDMFTSTSTGLVAVLPGEVWSAVASFRAKTAGKECRVDIRWRESDNSIISTSAGTHVMDTTTGWAESYCVAEAPTDAAYAEVIIGVFNVGAGGVHYVDQIALRPSNDNLLSLNQASFEVDLTGWTAGINADLGRSQATALVHSGLNSLAVTSEASGGLAARTAGMIPAKESVDYTVGLWSRAVSVARNWAILVRFYDDSGAQIGVDADTTSPQVANSVGAWSQLVYSPTSPAGTYFLSIHILVFATGAAGEVHVFDDPTLSQLYDSGVWAPGQVEWSRGGLSARKVEMQRSDDSGTTWQPVRLSVSTALDSPEIAPFTLNVPGQYRIVVVDHEAPPGIQVLYRARSLGQIAGFTLAGPWSYPMPAQLTIADHWLKDPLFPGSSMVLNLEPGVVVRRRQKVGVFEPLGAEFPIVRGDGRKGEAGDGWPVNTYSKAEHDALDLLLSSGRTLLLQLLAGEPQRYVAVIGEPASTYEVMRDEDDQWRPTRFSWVQVAPPA